MMVVTVEIWNGGDPRRKQHLSTLCLVNESDLAELSDYDVWLDGSQIGHVRHHRSDGAWVLVKRALRLVHQ